MPQVPDLRFEIGLSDSQRQQVEEELQEYRREEFENDLRNSEIIKNNNCMLNDHECRIKNHTIMINRNSDDLKIIWHETRNHEELLSSYKWAINVLFIIIGILVVLITLLASGILPAKAATIDMRDDSLGGFSYMMDCLEKNDIPEDYARILRKWHPAYSITLDEYDILVRIVEAEATGGNHEQKMNVASCVLARVEASQWPDNIEDVVFQKQQFTPVWDGRYFTVKITQSTKEAVDEVLKFGKTNDCLWFCSDKSYTKKDENGKWTSWHRREFGDSVFFDGEHHYFEGEKYD